jgi:perosamine synthetase
MMTRTPQSPPRGGHRPRRDTFLPFHVPQIGEAEIAEVVDTLRSGWLTMGPKTFRFEQQFAEYVGARHAVAVASCTAGLHLALDAAGVGPGDEVVTSVYTFTATAAVILHLGARPVLVDVRPDTLTLDPDAAARHVTPRTKAIVPVHLAGRPCDMDALASLAATRDLAVVEDAAHALPARYRGRTVGAIGDMTVFSFYATKTITTGEGGMVTTDSDDHAALLRARRLHGISRDAWKRYRADGSWRYEVEYPGYKCNMTDLAAAIGLHQLHRADEFHRARIRQAALYREGLADVPEIVVPDVPGDADHAWHLFIVQLDLGRLAIGRDEFIERLRDENIGTSVHFIPLNLHPAYQKRLGISPRDFPNAVAAYQRAISLPIYPGMTEDDVQDVIGAVRRLVKRHRRRSVALRRRSVAVRRRRAA